MGITNNHADPGQWFPKHGESMDTFRAAVKAALAGGIPVDPNPVYKPYVVKAGDSLWAIARDRLGSGARYREIMAINSLSSNLIRIGQTLYLLE